MVFATTSLLALISTTPQMLGQLQVARKRLSRDGESQGVLASGRDPIGPALVSEFKPSLRNQLDDRAMPCRSEGVQFLRRAACNRRFLALSVQT